MAAVEEGLKIVSKDLIRMQYLQEALLLCGVKLRFHLGKTMKRISSSKHC